jgi:hypothetical protein
MCNHGGGGGKEEKKLQAVEPGNGQAEASDGVQSSTRTEAIVADAGNT